MFRNLYKYLVSSFAVLMLPLVAVAQNTVTQAGASKDSDIAGTVINLYCEVAFIMVGPIGVLIGISIALYGFYKFIMSGSYGGIGLIVLGAIVPSFPSVYAGVTGFVAEAFPSAHVRAADRAVAGTTASILNEQCQTFQSTNVHYAYTRPQTAEDSEGTDELELKKFSSQQERTKAYEYIASCYGTLDIDMSGGEPACAISQ